MVMKKILPALMLMLAVSTLSCKKAVQEKQKDLLIQAMTNGVWLVDFYSEAGFDLTADFAGYEFQFLENGKVMGTKNSIITNGTWMGDINTQTISSDFPGAPYPLDRLNGTWKITDSYLDYVKSEMGTGATRNILYLKKKV